MNKKFIQDKKLTSNTKNKFLYTVLSLLVTLSILPNKAKANHYISANQPGSKTEKLKKNQPLTFKEYIFLGVFIATLGGAAFFTLAILVASD